MLIENLISEGITLLEGPLGSGKSYLATDMALCLATGTPFLGRNIKEKKKVLFFASFDNFDDFGYRVSRLANTKGIGKDDLVNLSFISSDDVNARKDLKLIPEDVEVVIFDQVSTKNYNKEFFELKTRGVNVIVLKYLYKTLDKNGDIADETELSRTADSLLLINKAGTTITAISRDYKDNTTKYCWDTEGHGFINEK